MICYLLPSKDVLVEIELQLLVGYVNTQLFKGVDTKVLKSENVQNSYIPDITLPAWHCAIPCYSILSKYTALAHFT